MRLFIVSLNSGASLIASNYYEVSASEYEFECISKEGIYYYTCLKQDILDIQDVDSEESSELLSHTYIGAKESYFLDEDFPMDDMCYCAARCKKKCARRKWPEGIHTISDLSEVCSDFEEE